MGGNGSARDPSASSSVRTGPGKASVRQGGRAAVRLAGESDDQLAHAAGQRLQQRGLDRREAVEAIHGEQRPVPSHLGRALLQRLDRQPPQPGAIGPALRLKAGLVGGVDLRQLSQPRLVAQRPHGPCEIVRVHARGLQLADQPLEHLDEAGTVGQGRVVGQRQAVHHGADQAVLHRLAQLDIDLAGGIEDFGVEAVEGEHAHADGAAHLGQAPPRGAGLQVGGDDDARDRGQVTR